MKKNILAENMLRFGAKNLSESDKQLVESAMLLTEKVHLNGAADSIITDDLNHTFKRLEKGGEWNWAPPIKMRINDSASGIGGIRYNFTITWEAITSGLNLELSGLSIYGDPKQITTSDNKRINEVIPANAKGGSHTLQIKGITGIRDTQPPRSATLMITPIYKISGRNTRKSLQDLFVKQSDKTYIDLYNVKLRIADVFSDGPGSKSISNDSAAVKFKIFPPGINFNMPVQGQPR